MTMTLLVGGTSANTFTAATIKNINLQQDCGIVNEVLPIDVLTVEVLATSITLYNNWVELSVDGALWCVYWLTDLRKTGTNTYKIVAKSPIVLLDTAIVAATMFASDNAYTYLNSLLTTYLPLVSIDSSLSSVTLSGYAPQQTARERLQWVLLSLPTMYRARTSFIRGIIIEQNTYTGLSIPASHVYLAPTLTDEQVVTNFKTIYHSYTPIPSPSGYTDVVQVGTNYYAHTANPYSLSSSLPEASYATYNEYGISDNTIINPSNVGAVASVLSTWYFNYTSTWRGRYLWSAGKPVGTACILPVTTTTTVIGYLKSAKYIFGSQGIAVDAEFTCQR